MPIVSQTAKEGSDADRINQVKATHKYAAEKWNVIYGYGKCNTHATDVFYTHLLVAHCCCCCCYFLKVSFRLNCMFMRMCTGMFAWKAQAIHFTKHGKLIACRFICIIRPSFFLFPYSLSPNSTFSSLLLLILSSFSFSFSSLFLFFFPFSYCLFFPFSLFLFFLFFSGHFPGPSLFCPISLNLLIRLSFNLKFIGIAW